MTILNLKFALIKERFSHETFAHDGFVPVSVNLDVYSGVVTNTIKRLCPQLNSLTRLFVIDQDGDEITFWPHKEGQLNEFGKWLRLNFVDGDRIKVYIEQPSNSKAVHKKIKNASANDSLTLARSPSVQQKPVTDRCIKCVCNRCMYDFAMHSEKQEKLSDRLKLVENSLRLLSASVENSSRLYEEKQPTKKIEDTLAE